MAKAKTVAVEMYRFLLDRILTQDYDEATFRENLDFEIIPISKYLAWIEAIAEKMTRYNKN
jgi:hypothetical protein